MNITLVYFSSAPTIGGLELNMFHSARSLVGRGHHVEILTTNSQNLKRAKLEPREEIDGVVIRRFGYLSVPGNKFTFFSPSMLRYLSSSKPDVVHVFSYLPSLFTNGACVVSKIRRLPLVVTPMFNPSRDLQYEGKLQKFAGRTFDRCLGPLTLKLADKTIPSTPDERDWLESKGRPVSDIIPTWAYGQNSPTGQLSVSEEELRGRWSIGNGPVVLAVGRIERRKGFDLLVRAFAAAREASPSARLVIVGDDWGEESALRTLAEDLGVAGSLILTGRVSDEDLASAYSMASCLVMCSRYEGLGVTPLEAWRRGTAVIAFDRFPGPITNETGLLTRYLDVEDLARGISRILTDRNLRVELENAGKAEADTRYNWDSIIERLENVYREVIGVDPNCS